MSPPYKRVTKGKKYKEKVRTSLYDLELPLREGWAIERLLCRTPGYQLDNTDEGRAVPSSASIYSEVSVRAPPLPPPTITTIEGCPAQGWEATCAQVRSSPLDRFDPTLVHARVEAGGGGGVDR